MGPMEILTISYAESRRLHGNETFNRVSRFIKEIPSECLHEIRLKTEIQRPVHYGRKKPAPMATEDSNGFYLGQRVAHKIFGEGVVVHFEGDGGSARVQVNFDREGSKWLVMQYANLEVV